MNQLPILYEVVLNGYTGKVFLNMETAQKYFFRSIKNYDRIILSTTF